jgi:hypothetical protein
LAWKYDVNLSYGRHISVCVLVVVTMVQYFLSIIMFLNLPVRFAVREKYPLDRAHQREGPPTAEKLHSILSAAKPADGLKKILIPHVGTYIAWIFMSHFTYCFLCNTGWYDTFTNLFIIRICVT